MAGRTSTTSTTAQTPAPTADAFRAFADYMTSGGTDDFNTWWASDAGRAAATAFADQVNAALRTARQSATRAVWRDLKNNGQVTTYSRDRAILVRDYLVGLDMDNVPEPTSDDTADDATNGDAS